MHSCLRVSKLWRTVFHFGSEARVSVINFSGSGMSDSISVIKQKDKSLKQVKNECENECSKLVELCTNTIESFEACRSYTGPNQLLLYHSLMPHTTYLLHQTTRKMTPMVEGPSGKRIKPAKHNTTSERGQKRKERKVNYAGNNKNLALSQPFNTVSSLFRIWSSIPCGQPLSSAAKCFCKTKIYTMYTKC